MAKNTLTFITVKEKRFLLSHIIQTHTYKNSIDKLNDIPGVCIADMLNNKIGITTTIQMHQALSSCLSESPFIWANEIVCEDVNISESSLVPVWYFSFGCDTDFFISRLCKYLQGVTYFCDNVWSDKKIGELNIGSHVSKRHSRKRE